MEVHCCSLVQYCHKLVQNRQYYYHPHALAVIVPIVVDIEVEIVVDIEVEIVVDIEVEVVVLLLSSLLFRI